MTATREIESAVRAVLENDSTINLHEHPVAIAISAPGTLILQGEVEDIVAKRRAVQLSKDVPGVQQIMDYLRLIPSERRGDGAVLDSVYQALTQEPVFHGCTIVARDPNPSETVREPRDNETGSIEITVADAVVTLTGHVQSLTHKRLADVLSWWVRGTADVSNRLRVVPAEKDNDDEITDALRIVLEKDPWLDAGQIRIRTQNQEVLLEGLVRSREQRHMAECDAWYILGVHQVTNRIEVRP